MSTIGTYGDERIERYAGFAQRYLQAGFALAVDSALELNIPQEGPILDIGTGPGDLAIFLARKMPARKIIAFDYSVPMLQFAKKRAGSYSLTNISFKQGNVHALAIEDNSIALAISKGSLHQWNNPKGAFQEIYRILRPGGVAFIEDVRGDTPAEVVHAIAACIHEAEFQGEFFRAIEHGLTIPQLEKILQETGIPRPMTFIGYDMKVLARHIVNLLKGPIIVPRASEMMLHVVFRK